MPLKLRDNEASDSEGTPQPQKLITYAVALHPYALGLLSLVGQLALQVRDLIFLLFIQGLMLGP